MSAHNRRWFRDRDPLRFVVQLQGATFPVFDPCGIGWLPKSARVVVSTDRYLAEVFATVVTDALVEAFRPPRATQAERGRMN